MEPSAAGTMFHFYHTAPLARNVALEITIYAGWETDVDATMTNLHPPPRWLGFIRDDARFRGQGVHPKLQTRKHLLFVVQR